MKLAVSGKGGSGKTTLVGSLSRALAQRGHQVLTIDADPNPNLAATLGLSPTLPPRFLSESLVQEIATPAGERQERLTLRPEALLEQYGVAAPDGVRLLTVGTVEQAGTGCNCSFHSVVRGVLGELSDRPDWVSLTDMEAGLEHLKRGTVQQADALLIILEPYFRSLETGARVQQLARELGVPSVFAIGNKVRAGTGDLDALTEYCRRHELDWLAWVPYDDAFMEADRQRRSALDLRPDSPGVKAIHALAEKLKARLMA